MKKHIPGHDLCRFGIGFTLGVMLARWLSTDHRRIPGHIPHLAAWEKALAAKTSSRKAALLAAKVQARFEHLYLERPRFRNAALRDHLEMHILPGIALFQVLRESESPDQSLATLDDCFTAQVQASNMVRQAALIDALPGGFALLRLANRIVLRAQFPQQGWQIEWAEDSSKKIAYNITDCFYLNVLRAYGVPELTAHFCAMDDQIYGGLQTIAWGRTETLGRGNARCNFVFRPRS